MLSQQAIQDFQDIYKKEFGAEISHQEAEVMGVQLLTFFRLILQPVQKKLVKEKLKEVKEVMKNGDK